MFYIPILHLIFSKILLFMRLSIKSESVLEVINYPNSILHIFARSHHNYGI
jgi:hypothetical protein